MFIFTFLLASALSLVYVYLKYNRLHKLADKFPGPPALPILGNIFNFSVKSNEEALKLMTESHKKYGEIFRIKVLHIVALMVYDPKIYEIVLSSPTKHLKKNNLYDFLLPWLGEGLITSYGKKWHGHRKTLTPAFHFKILEQFIEIFDRQSNVLVGKLKNECEKDVVDIQPFVTLMTLDIICETAMGTKINAQNDSESSYVKAVEDVSCTLALRISNIWKRNDLLFNIFAREDRKKIDDILKILHDFTNNVIIQRRDRLLNNDMNNDTKSEENDDVGMSKKMTFLDILLQSTSTIDGKPLSNVEIREEVDTFMFAGHDTTTGSITFTLYLLSRHPAIQQKLFDEIKEVIGTDKSAPITYRQLQDLKYMDLVLKESFRMLPPVPAIGRYIEEDILLDDGRIIPADTNITLNFFMTFKDPKYFKNPEIFDPDRFSPENQASTKINPYAYTPFSAGPRNCIGQKFALLETKASVSKVLRHFELLPRGEEPNIVYEMVSRTRNGIQMGLKPRTY